MGLSSTDIYFNSAFKYNYVAVHPNTKKSNVFSSISSAYYSLLTFKAIGGLNVKVKLLSPSNLSIPAITNGELNYIRN